MKNLSILVTLLVSASPSAAMAQDASAIFDLNIHPLQRSDGKVLTSTTPKDSFQERLADVEISLPFAAQLDDALSFGETSLPIGTVLFGARESLKTYCTQAASNAPTIICLIDETRDGKFEAVAMAHKTTGRGNEIIISEGKVIGLVLDAPVKLDTPLPYRQPEDASSPKAKARFTWQWFGGLKTRFEADTDQGPKFFSLPTLSFFTEHAESSPPKNLGPVKIISLNNDVMTYVINDDYNGEKRDFTYLDLRNPIATRRKAQ